MISEISCCPSGTKTGYQASKTASEDLNGDGKVDRISCQVTEQENGEILCTLTVNGDTYIANELSASVSDSADLETEKGNFDLYVFTPGHSPAEESLLKSTEFCGIFPFVLSPYYCT